jgi:hypothetical protein
MTSLPLPHQDWRRLDFYGPINGIVSRACPTFKIRPVSSLPSATPPTPPQDDDDDDKDYNALAYHNEEVKDDADDFVACIFTNGRRQGGGPRVQPPADYDRR